MEDEVGGGGGERKERRHLSQLNRNRLSPRRGRCEGWDWIIGLLPAVSCEHRALPPDELEILLSSSRGCYSPASQPRYIYHLSGQHLGKQPSSQNLKQSSGWLNQNRKPQMETGAGWIAGLLQYRVTRFLISSTACFFIHHLWRQIKTTSPGSKTTNAFFIPLGYFLCEEPDFYSQLGLRKARRRLPSFHTQPNDGGWCKGGVSPFTKREKKRRFPISEELRQLQCHLCSFGTFSWTETRE